MTPTKRFPRLLVITALLGAAISTTSAVRAGECVEPQEDYVVELEEMIRQGPPYRYCEALQCIGFRPERGDPARWSGPAATRRFARCRTYPYRDRIAAACAHLLADSASSGQDFDSQQAGAQLAARFGIRQIGSHDLFRIITDEIRASEHFPEHGFQLLAIMQDPRTLHFLRDFQESLIQHNSKIRAAAQRDVLNCLYHVPGDSALVLAKEIQSTLTDPELRERARLVLER